MPERKARHPVGGVTTVDTSDEAKCKVFELTASDVSRFCSVGCD